MNRRPESRPEFLLRSCARRHEDRRVNLYKLVLLHRPHLEIRASWCEAHREFTKSQSPALNRLPESGWHRRGRGDEQDRQKDDLLSVDGRPGRRTREPAALDSDARVLSEVREYLLSITRLALNVS